MSASRKKVIVRLLNQELRRGYLPGGGLAPEGLAELLLADGRALPLPISDIQHVAYVRDFNLDDPIDPERMGFRSFASRPRGTGIWVRVRFAEGDALEGLSPDGLPLLDAVLLDRGIFLEPPDKRSNTLRIFIPRSAMTGFEVLGVAGQAVANRRPIPVTSRAQGGLFDTDPV